MTAHRAAVRAAGALEEVHAKVAGNGGGLDPAHVGRLEAAREAAAGNLAAPIRELTALGVQVKDLDEGLINFPARHPSTGETVLLCWRLGEPDVAFWHGTEEGFAGRKPLPF